MSSSLARVMAQWDALHPFNVLVSVRVQGTLEESGLRAAAAHEDPSASVEIRHETGAASDAGYERTAGLALNTRVPALRIGVVAWPDAHIVTVRAPHHSIDGVSAFAALVRLVTRYCGAIAPAAVPLSSRAGARGKPSHRMVPWHRWPRLVASSFSESLAFARCHRPASGSAGGLADTVATLALPADTRPGARAVARDFGGTANDVLVAAMAEAILETTRTSRGNGSRPAIALALPVDLRAIKPEALRHSTDVCVSFINVVLAGGERPFASILEEVAAATASAKRTRSHAKTALEMWAAARLARGLRRDERSRYFSRQRPYCGVVTSPRVPSAWLAPEVQRRCSQWRLAVSSGPMTPLVMAVTTGPDDRMECVLSQRGYGYSAAESAAIRSAVGRRLAAVALRPEASSSWRDSA